MDEGGATRFAEGPERPRQSGLAEGPERPRQSGLAEGPERPGQSGRSVRRHAEVDSTNRVVADLARAGAEEGVVVVADHQTAGRGRWGRRWEAPPGSSLLASVLLRPRLDSSLVALVTLAAGVAAAEACAAEAGLRPTLKWPNDVMVGDAKVGGILTELVPGDPVPSVVVGVGLNLHWDGPLPEGATALSRETSVPVDRDRLLDAFLQRLDLVSSQLTEPSGRGDVLDRYRASSSTLGRMVTVTLPDEEIRGRAIAIRPDGGLVIEVGDGIERELSAGAVSHLRG